MTGHGARMHARRLPHVWRPYACPPLAAYVASVCLPETMGVASVCWPMTSRRRSYVRPGLLLADDDHRGVSAFVCLCSGAVGRLDWKMVCVVACV